MKNCLVGVFFSYSFYVGEILQKKHIHAILNRHDQISELTARSFALLMVVRRL